MIEQMEKSLWELYDSYKTNTERLSVLDQWIEITTRYIDAWKREKSDHYQIEVAEAFVARCREKQRQISSKMN